MFFSASILPLSSNRDNLFLETADMRLWLFLCKWHGGTDETHDDQNNVHKERFE